MNIHTTVLTLYLYVRIRNPSEKQNFILYRAAFISCRNLTPLVAFKNTLKQKLVVEYHV